ncbi:transglycosylase SLT domain-containing protein [Halodesulfovibrio marinisediminis]|uniref:Transglycosylase SLT domain-containing protein n=1 Tax=Halodesulfovibrio marinisediminis DSM 17456 TaxID=1121457 RepID=A0A1N6F6J2_9BACT|nr:transglycosylase SLT domain-containing protein [Halodesulfovibrio marinisediminis]SIN90877.1 Transglycosylase SLT domain-containing protein [Halodesulfovibrio marinisediminis DSM 17456]
MKRRFFTSWEAVLLLLLISAQTALMVGPEIVTYLYRIPPVRVVVPNVSQFSSLVSPYGLGVDGELLSSFAKKKGYTINIVRVKSAEEAWKLISHDEADLLVGFGGDIPAEYTKKITAGPAYDEYQSVTIKDTSQADNKELQALCSSLLDSVPEGVDEAIYNENATFLSSLADALPEVVSPRKNSEPSGQTPYAKEILSKTTPAPQKKEQRKEAPATVVTVNEDALENVDCVNFDRFHMYHLMSFDSDEGGTAQIDVRNFTMLRPFFLDVVPKSQANDGGSYRWFWRNKFFAEAGLQKDLTEFWKEVEAKGTVAILKEKHYGFFPEDLNYYVIGKLKKALRRKMPKYAKTMKKASEENEIDPLLLAAVIFQESHFNNNARSRTGVRGLMQITQATAKELGINRIDPHQSIMGGAMYLRKLWDRLEDQNLEKWDRWFFTLAAYNQGYGHVLDAIKLSQKRGGTGKTWQELKDILPLLAWKRYYSQTRHGYCRGYEAVTYVENIRYYYYLINGLVALSRPEGEHLGELRSSISSATPNS